MKRRGFLGLLGAGAIAGPAVAKNAITQANPLVGGGVMTSLPMPGIGYHGEVKEAQGLLNQFDRISKLKRLISGEEEEERQPWELTNDKRIRAEHAINCLGSVSQTSKMRMMIQASQQIHKEEQRKHWMNELLSLESFTKMIK